jgi:uncharacterized protein YijF (DUF1287 family)
MRRTLVVCLTAAATLSLVAQSCSAEFVKRLVAAANDRPNHPARYEPACVKIAYPNGDVPADTGVCTDEIIRIYRAVGVDLQKEVHEDMAANGSAYPRRFRWLQVRLDTNIDHRCVPNLMIFFGRKGQNLPIHSIHDANALPDWGNRSDDLRWCNDGPSCGGAAGLLCACAPGDESGSGNYTALRMIASQFIPRL